MLAFGKVQFCIQQVFGKGHAYTVPAALRWGLLRRVAVLMFMWWRKRKWLVASRLGWAGLGKDFFGAKFMSNLVLGWGCLQEVVFLVLSNLC